LPILPPVGEFPYTIRMTSEVTSSNGSSSMASVCGATLSLLDAGVPIKAPAAGISIGLATNGSNELLIDLTGTEDHYGQMDFKIAGTKDEVTAFQLDVKQPLSLTVVADALEFARQGRIEILKEMSVQSEKTSEGAVSGLRPRADLKSTAPRVEIVRFDPVRKRDLLGPGGVVIRQMEDRFNVSLDLTQEGQCLLFGDDVAMVKKARAAVMDLVSDVEVGLTYEGTVIELRDFGAIIELLRNKEGLCHISELATREEIRNHPSGSLGLVNELLHEGQKIDVVCTAVDVIQGTIRVRPASKIKKK
jgi:polyribonucleotide nucleotidyltransferase